MRLMTIVATTMAALAILPAEEVKAQFYRFGPGGLRVRAPGVGVYVGPGIGASIRAPYTSLYVPRYPVPPFVRPPIPYPVPYPAWYRPAPNSYDTSRGRVSASAAWPTDRQLAAMGYRDLWRVLAAAAAQLEGQLNRFSTAETWHRYLKIQMLRELSAQDTGAAPDETARAELAAALAAFHSTAANEDFDMVAALSGFQAVESVLADLVISPLERQRLRLAQSAFALQESLGLFGTAAQWQQYLELPAEVFEPGEDSADGLALLEKALIHFNEVSSDPRYRTIARLPQFRATYDDLAAYVAQLVPPGDSTTQGESAFEELPPPTPSPQQ